MSVGIESLIFVIKLIIVFIIFLIEVIVIIFFVLAELIREFAGILVICEIDSDIVYGVVVVSPEVVVSAVHSFLVESFVLRFLSCLQMYKI